MMVGPGNCGVGRKRKRHHQEHRTARIDNAMIQMELATERLVESPSTIRRRLAAIAFADVAGFSRLIALNEVETLRRWKILRTEIMAPHMERQGGRVTQTPGDAVLVEFPSVVNAVRW